LSAAKIRAAFVGIYFCADPYRKNHRSRIHCGRLARAGRPIGTSSVASLRGSLQSRFKRTGQFWKPGLMLVIVGGGLNLGTMLKRFWLPMALLVFFTIMRLPGLLPPNFSPVYAIAFCAGVYFPRRAAWWAPLSLIFLSDCALAIYYWTDLGINPFHGSALLGMAGNYAAFAAIIALGRTMNRKTSWLGLVSGGLAAAVIFYFVTNTFAWMSLREYPKNLAGLIQALTVGLPNWPHTWEFFGNTLKSGGLFTGLFAAAMKAQEAVESAKESEEEPEASPEAKPEEA
jgi:hypothetical protein